MTGRGCATGRFTRLTRVGEIESVMNLNGNLVSVMLAEDGVNVEKKSSKSLDNDGTTRRSRMTPRLENLNDSTAHNIPHPPHGQSFQQKFSGVAVQREPRSSVCKNVYLPSRSNSFVNSMRKNIRAELLTWRRDKRYFGGPQARHDSDTAARPRLTRSTKTPQDSAPQAEPSKSFTAFLVLAALAFLT